MTEPKLPLQDEPLHRDEVVELVIHWLQSSPTKTQFRLTRSQVQAVVDLALKVGRSRSPKKPKRWLKEATSRRNQNAARISDWLRSSLTKTRFTLTRSQVQTLVDLAVRVRGRLGVNGESTAECSGLAGASVSLEPDFQ